MWVLSQRVFLGRNVDKASTLILRDGSGRKRLVLSVSDAGAATIQFMDEKWQRRSNSRVRKTQFFESS
jgi:hypothetical protein